MKRREVLKAGGIAGILAAAQFPLIKSAWAQDRYAKYKGTTVVMSVPAHPHYDAMAKILPDFTAETGIKVELDKIAMGRLKDKQLLEMSKPQGDYDLVCYIVMWKSEYVAKNLVAAAGAVSSPIGAGRPDLRHRRTSSRSTSRTSGWSAARRATSRAPARSSTGCPTAPRPRCSPIARTSSPSTTWRRRENYDDFAEDPARHQGQGRHRGAHLARPGRAPVRARVAAAPQSAGRRGVRRPVAPALQRQDRGAGAEVPPGGGGHRTGRHPRLRPGRGQHGVPAGAGGDVPRLDVLRRPGERPDDQQDRRQGRLGAAPQGRQARIAVRRPRPRDSEELQERRGRLPAAAVADVQGRGQGGDQGGRRADAAIRR